MPKDTRYAAATRAAQALVDLNLFAAMMTIAEGSDIRGPKARRAARKIERICREAQQECLERYDYERQTVVEMA